MFQGVDDKQYYLHAAHDWADTQAGVGIGHYQCFCEKHFSFKNFFFYTKHYNLCDKFDKLYLKNMMVEMLFTYGITITDILFQYINIYIVQ